MKLLEFACVGHRFAVPVAAVARLIPSALPTPLPGAPAMVMGALSLGGQVVVVVDTAFRFGLGAVPLRAEQRIVVLSVPGFLLGVVVDEPVRVTEQDIDTKALPQPCMSGEVAGMVVASDGLRVLIDPEYVLLREDEDKLRRALAAYCHVQP